MSSDTKISLRELATYWDSREIGGKLGPYGLIHWYAIGRFGHSLVLRITQSLLNAGFDEREESLSQITLSLGNAIELIHNDAGIREELIRSTKIVLEAERIQWSSLEDHIDERLEQLVTYLSETVSLILEWRERYNLESQTHPPTVDCQIELHNIISRLVWSYHFIHSKKLEYGEKSVLLTWLPEIHLLSKAYEVPGKAGGDFKYRIYPTVQSVLDQGPGAKLYQLLSASLKLGSVAHSQTPCLGYVKAGDRGTSGFRQIIDSGGFVAGDDELGSSEFEGTGNSEWSDLFYFNRSALKLNLDDNSKTFAGRLYVCSVLDVTCFRKLLSFLVSRKRQESEEDGIFEAIRDLWHHSGPDATAYLRDSIGNLVNFHHQVNEQSKFFAEAALFQEIKGEIDGLIQIDQKTHILLQRIQEKLRRVSRGFLRYYDEIKELFRDSSTFHYRMDENDHVIDIGKPHWNALRIETAHGPPRHASTWIDYATFLHAFGRSRHNKFLDTMPIAISMISLRQAGSLTRSSGFSIDIQGQRAWKELLEAHRQTDWNTSTIVQGFCILKWALQKSHGKTDSLHPYQLLSAILARLADERLPLSPSSASGCGVSIGFSYSSGENHRRVIFQESFQSDSFIGLLEALCAVNARPRIDSVHSFVGKMNEGDIPLAKIPAGIRPSDVMDALMRLLRIELMPNEPALVRLRTVEMNYCWHSSEDINFPRGENFLEVRIRCNGFFEAKALSELQNLTEDAGNRGLRSCLEVLCRSANQLMPEIVDSDMKINDRGVWILREDSSENQQAAGDQICVRWPLCGN